MQTLYREDFYSLKWRQFGNKCFVSAVLSDLAAKEIAIETIFKIKQISLFKMMLALDWVEINCDTQIMLL